MTSVAAANEAAVNEVVAAAAVEESSVPDVPSRYEAYWAEYPGAVLEVNIDELDIDEADDVRNVTAKAGANDKEFKAFTAVIDQNGYQPPEVRIVNGRLKVVDGRRRIAALMTLGRTVVRVLPANDGGVNIDRVTAITRALAFNMARKDLSPVEKMKSIVKLQEAAAADGKKITINAIATSIGMSTGGVSGYLSLKKYNDAALELIDTGKVSYGAAIAFMAEVGPETASDQLIAMAAQNDGKPVTFTGAKKAARAKNEASNAAATKKGAAPAAKSYSRTSSQAVSELLTLQGQYEKTAAEYKVLQAFLAFMRGMNSTKTTLNTVLKVCGVQ